jgi:undecaprenyl-diphosphatase
VTGAPIETRLWTAAAIAFALCIALGAVLSRMPAASGFERRIANALRGHAVPLAAFFTYSGRAIPLAFLSAASVLAALFLRVSIWIALAIIAAQIVSQLSIELLKRGLRRARPDEWLVHAELGYSYPSGHAATAIVFFGSWLMVVALSPWPHPVKLALAAVLAAWMLGIDWSRLALGAHYPTDVLGGTLFGLAWNCALWAVLL